MSESEEVAGPQSLSFEPKLFVGSGNRAKTVAVASLTSQLKKLSQELSDLDQETVDVRSLDLVTKQLLTKSLINHKDPGIRIYVACCIADLLRLYAPDAPYSPSELETIFTFFARQLQNLSDTNGHYYPLYTYLLESLATVKCMALVAELDDSESLVVQYFRVLFEVIRPTQARQVHNYMTEVLQQLIEEVEQVSQAAIDIILLQFLRKRQEENPAAYQMACDIGNATTDILQKYVCQYFNDVITSASRPQEDGSKADMNDIRTAHHLILELNKATPALLLSVVPQIELELGVENAELRAIATQILGEMLAEKGFTLAKRYNSTWRAWQRRRADPSVQVRIKWVSKAVALFQHQPQLARELNEMVIEKLSDADEKVRAAACEALGRLKCNAAVYSSLSERTVRQLGERCRDRKVHVRKQATMALGLLYEQAYNDILTNNPIATQIFGGIPEMVLSLVYTNNPEVLSNAHIALGNHVFAPNAAKDDYQRALRLVFVLTSVSERAKIAFGGLMKLQVEVDRELLVYLQYSEKYDPNITSESNDAVGQRLQAIIQRLAERFPEPVRYSNYFTQLASYKDEALTRGLRTCITPSSDFRVIRKAQKEVLKRLQAVGPSLVEPIALVLKSVSLTTLNKSIVPPLISMIGNQGKLAPVELDSAPRVLISRDMVRTAQRIIEIIGKLHPKMFLNHISELFTQFTSLDYETEPCKVQEQLRVVVDFAKTFSKHIPSDKYLEKMLTNIVMGGDVECAKRAATVLSAMPDATAQCESVVKELFEMAQERPERLAAALAALSKFAQYAPKAFSAASADIVNYVVKNVLMSNAGEVKPESESVAAWVDRYSLSQMGLAKVYAVKLLTNRLFGLHVNDWSKSITVPVLNLLRTLVRDSGELLPEKDTNHINRNHLRLTGASCLLKLARSVVFERMITIEDFRHLALVAQDPCYQVRDAFLTKKLIPALASMRVHARYISTLFLVAHDPEKDIKNNVKHFVAQRLSQIRPGGAGTPAISETCFPEFLDLLAHHPDWDDNELMATVELFTPYINFYLSCAATANNSSLLYHYASRLKTVRSAYGEEAISRRLYVLGELASYLIQAKCMAANWGLPTYPGTAPMSAELFIPIPPEEQQQMSRRSFLPVEFIEKLEQQLQAANSKKSSSSKPSTDRLLAGMKRGSPRSPRTKQSKRTKVKELAEETPSRIMRRRSTARGKTLKEESSDTELESDMDSDY